VSLLVAAFAARSLFGQEIDGEKPVHIFAAASTTNAIQEIKQQFTAATGIQARTNFGSSAALAKQIANGAAADVFLSADTKWAEDLVKKGLVAKKRELLGNRLVLVVPNDSRLAIAKPDDLVSEKVKHIAMGDVKSVPAGVYAKKALEKLGLWKRLKPKIAEAEDVRHALAFVETGAADAGFVYATDAAISKMVKVVAVMPESLTGPIRYPVVLLNQEGGPRTSASDFYDFLNSPNATGVFQKYGFVVLLIPR
jgi:molybdate transport system substrate-binding protein